MKNKDKKILLLSQAKEAIDIKNKITEYLSSLASSDNKKIIEDFLCEVGMQWSWSFDMYLDNYILQKLVDFNDENEKNKNSSE